MLQIYKRLSLLITVLIVSNLVFAQTFSYQDNWGEQGLTLKQEKSGEIILNHSVTEFMLLDQNIDGVQMKTVKTTGTFLPNDEGAPDLPGNSRFIAIPQGAEATVEILSMRKEKIDNVNIAPAPRIPWDTETGPLHYEKNPAIYNADQFYPQEPVLLSQHRQLRGVDVVMLGVTPFQYNPVTKELIVYKDIKIRINIKGGNGQVGDDRLRSRWWDPIIYDAVINPGAIPAMDYSKKKGNSDTPDYEYLIITPDDPTFISWADSIKRWRTLQGISTGIVTTTDVGGNTTTAIESYVNNAYNTWAVPPVAVLLLGDYGTSGSTVVSPIYNSYCVSDNIYSDVDGDHMPEMIFARMTAQNATHLETMITKFLDYERTPPTNSTYYNNPITACGWQTERWFQLCSEIVGGYWKYVMGKNPVRINEIYSGTPGSSWSTTTYGNTTAVVNYFGPSGYGYIPATPDVLGGWTGGNATMINNAINNGAFMLQHRDHGYEQGWGEPDYSSSDINGLHNTDLTWVMSINCLTGKYNYSSEVFTEKFHRYTYNGQNSGALGLTAASEVSYSFVNDVFVWGMYDNMWPDFMPTYGTTPESRDVLPSFGQAAGKIFLEASSWPYNTSNKEVTYNLFHHHGDAFTTVYANMPQYLTVTHDAVLLSGVTSFTVTANNGSFIALTVNGEILGTAEGTGSPVSITIPAQDPGETMIVTVTKQDYYRYSTGVDVIPPSGPYITYDSHSINDASGNNDGQADYGESIQLNMTVENAGSATAHNVNATLASTDSYVTITDNSAAYGTIISGGFATVNNAFALDIADDVPDQHVVAFGLQMDGNTDDTWLSNFSIVVNAPEMNTGTLTINDTGSGNGDGRLDPGETADIIIGVLNDGSSDSPDAIATLNTASPYLNINSGPQNLGSIASGTTGIAAFNVTADAGTPVGTTVNMNLNVTAGNYTASDVYSEVIGQVPVLILNMDPTNNSAPAMATAMTSLGVSYDLATSFPADLNIYTSVFVCLGIYSSNHVLSSSEGTTLANYLNAGGQLYMEGGDTWYFDSQTAVHSMFGINATSDGTSDMSTVAGQSGTFTSGMSFIYSGENNWMDHIDPVSPAYSILQNTSPVYGTGVAYNAGTYKTIGTSHEFGGLNDATFPSTKEELMNQYLTFFGITGTPLLPPDIGVNPISFEVTLAPDETQTEVMTITNSGEQQLNFNIGVSGSDAPGKMVQQLSKEEMETLRYKDDLSNQFDELATGTFNPDEWVLPPIQKFGPNDSEGEETFGSWAGGSFSGGARDRGNIFHVTTATTLQEIRFYMSISASTSLYFFVYEGNAVADTYTEIEEIYIASSGTGEGWYSSGSIAVPLEAGKYYYIGTSWNGTATYGRGTEAVPLATSFGTLETGIPGNVAGYPPGTTCTNSYTDFSPYYQTLVTSTTPVFTWLETNPASGSVPAFGSTNIDVIFDATGMTEGTYYKALEISSNDPDQPLITVPCTLNVSTAGLTLNAKAFLQGPFAGTEMMPYLNYNGMIPLNQPYNMEPWYYTGSESVAAIPNTDVIDWVLVELRETSGGPETATPVSMVEQQAAFILKDGSIVTTDGASPLAFDHEVTANLYVIVWHRNHLGIMSATPAVLNGDVYEYDFTTAAGQVYGNGCAHTQIGTGIWGMTAGDANCDMEINNLDKNDKWYMEYSNIGYYTSDLDMNGQVDNADKNIPWNANAGACSFIVK